MKNKFKGRNFLKGLVKEESEDTSFKIKQVPMEKQLEKLGEALMGYTSQRSKAKGWKF